MIYLSLDRHSRKKRLDDFCRLGDLAFQVLSKTKIFSAISTIRILDEYFDFDVTSFGSLDIFGKNERVCLISD